jgi:Ca2+-binding RTX toxin-like protein
MSRLIGSPSIAQHQGMEAFEAAAADAETQAGPISGRVDGTPGDDLLYGTENADWIRGLDGDDAIYGFEGADSLYGNAGNDFLKGGPGNDLLDGGSGFDRASFYGAETGVHVNLNVTHAQDTGAGRDTLLNIEDVSGTTFDDVLIGNNRANWLWGSDGGDESLFGGAGDDLLTVQVGDCTLIGGVGHDTVAFSSNGFDLEPALHVDLSLQGSVQDTGAGMMLLQGIENLSAQYGEEEDDSLTGDRFANVLAGADGSDNLVGGNGQDLLLGDGMITTEGLDGAYIVQYLAGWGLGNDYLDGGQGADTLVGGAGADMLVGGANRDVFLFTALGDCVPGLGGAVDAIMDLEHRDIIDLSGMDANVNEQGDQAFTLVTHGFTQSAGEALYAYDGGPFATLSFDTDGDGSAEAQIRIFGVKAHPEQFVL